MGLFLRRRSRVGWPKERRKEKKEERTGLGGRKMGLIQRERDGKTEREEEGQEMGLGQHRLQVGLRLLLYLS